MQSVWNLARHLSVRLTCTVCRPLQITKPFTLSLSKGFSMKDVVRPFGKLRTGQAHHERGGFTLAKDHFATAIAWLVGFVGGGHLGAALAVGFDRQGLLLDPVLPEQPGDGVGPHQPQRIIAAG